MLQIAGGLVLGAVGLWFLLFVFVALMALSEPKPKWKKKYGEETVDPSGMVWTNMGKVNSIDTRKFKNFMGMEEK